VADNLGARFGAALAAGGLALAGIGAKVAHLGPFADDALRVADAGAMSALAFRDNASAMRQGTFLEKQAVEVACSLFTSLSTTGQPPAGWTTFGGVLTDRSGIGTSTSYLNTKIEQLAVTADLAQQQPQLAVKYVEYCF
jgi:hypothetical protein